MIIRFLVSCSFVFILGILIYLLNHMKLPKPKKKWIIATGIVLLVPIFALFIVFQVLTRSDPENRFTHAGIMAILSKESTVFYNDEKTRLGAFFKDIHRNYIAYEHIPASLINALVSAEDKNFFKHGGVDFVAIAYAMVDNIKSLSVKRGGSSLTQQAAKNLFPAQGRGTWARAKAKLPELINAYRLERNFSKQEILEFYLNQFYVAGNGHGVSIAARYFFAKPLDQLTLKQLAFIAGSVKGPNQYNPFIARSQKEKEHKLKRASYRVHYVLNKMLENKKIDSVAHAAALKAPFDFEKGRFRFKLSTNMVKVQKFLETKKIQKLFEEHQISDYPAAGLKIVTTLDKDIQEAVEYYSNKNLSTLDIILRGYQKPNTTRMSLAPMLRPGKFVTGKICSLTVKDSLAIQVQFGAKKCWITKKSLHDFLRLYNRHQTGRRSLPKKSKRKAILKQFFNIGDWVFCSVPWVYTVSDTNYRLDIEKVPLLQGGTRVTHQGQVLANSGGFGNTGYDRVDQAKRQFGSTFKPLVYAAAIELGWSPLDTLLNGRQVFRLGPTFYFPRPYHTPPPVVSMAWAGKYSENIASIYLLYRMMDKMSFHKFWQACEKLGSSPSNFTSREDFISHVRDTMGLLMTQPRKRDIKFRYLAEEVATDLVFEGEDDQAETLLHLPYGWGFEREAKRYKKRRRKEDIVRYNILQHNFLAYFKRARSWVAETLPAGQIWYDSTAQRWGHFLQAPGAPWVRNTLVLPDDDSKRYIEGKLSVKNLLEINSRLHSQKLSEHPYSKENLYLSAEFRALVSLRFMIQFCKSIGIHTKLDPVLSLPLGSNTISLSETVDAYQTLKDGRAYHSVQTDAHHLYVKSIALPNGEVIYYDTLITDPVISTRTKNGSSAILRTIVEGGTGTAVYRRFRVNSSDKNKIRLRVPAYGKTGTTNDHRNGAFLGYIAAPEEDGRVSPEAGYTIGVYVGFDDNTKMEHKGFRGFGGTVSLNAWIGTANAIAQCRKFSETIDFLDLDSQTSGLAPISQSENYRQLKVHKSSGLPLETGQNIPSDSISFVHLKVDNHD